jgi:hypothetical protein
VRVQVVPAGQSSPVVIDAELDLKEGVYYTVAATGFLNSMVRVAHLSPDAPAVDVLVNGQRAITNLAFKEVTPYIPLPAAKVRYIFGSVISYAFYRSATAEGQLSLEEMVRLKREFYS